MERVARTYLLDLHSSRCARIGGLRDSLRAYILFGLWGRLGGWEEGIGLESEED